MRMHRLLMPAVTVAGALALAGCGGGGGTTTTGGTSCPDGQTRVAGNCLTAAEKAVADATAAVVRAEEAVGKLTVASTSTSAEAGMIGTARRMVNALPAGDDKDDLLARLEAADNTVGLVNSAIASGNDSERLEIVNDLLEYSQKAEKARGDSQDFHKAANDLVEKLDAKSVNGDSQMAFANAKKILETRKSVEEAHKAADDAVKKLEGIDKTGLAADLTGRIDRAITNAKRDRDAIKAILEAKATDEDSLLAAENAVKEGAPTSAEGDFDKLAQARADAVAKDISDGIGTIRGARGSIAFASNPVTFTSGKTFREITGQSRITVTDISDFFAEDGLPAAASTIALAAEIGSSPTYDGIPGSLRCLSANCATGADGKVTAGEVEFIPASPAIRYHRADFGADYTPVQNAAAYGYWLTAAGAIGRHYDSLTDPNNTALRYTRAADATSDVKATYSGGAGGYSYVKEGEGDDEVKHSGEFAAKVELNATFGAEDTNSNISGSITGFTGADGKAGKHVNENWRIFLSEETANITNFGPENTATHNFNTNASVYVGDAEGPTDGAWNALAYGEATELPSGFVGAFDAEFEDGGAAGVYHAEAE